MKAITTSVTKAAIAASRKYPEKTIWYFRKVNNECFVIGGFSNEAFAQSRISPTHEGVECRMYKNGRKIG
jgi:hypothetical protein